MQEKTLGYSPFLVGNERVSKAVLKTFEHIGIPCFETKADAKAYGVKMLESIEMGALVAGIIPPKDVEIVVNMVFRGGAKK